MNSDVAVVHYSYRLQTAQFTPFQSDSAVKHDIIKHTVSPVCYITGLCRLLLKEISIYEMTPDPGRALSLAICEYFVSFMVNCDDLKEFVR